jgi:hypothetical protein
MIYLVCILGGFSFYLWWQVQSLKRKEKSISHTLGIIIDIIQPSEEPKPYEWRVISSRNKMKIEMLEEEIRNIKGQVSQALNYTSSIIRHSKQHPIPPESIDKFISEEGLLNDESPPKRN